LILEVSGFEQTPPCGAFYIWLRAGEFMAVPKKSKHKDYARYAAHCLGLSPALTDREDRAINREMAAEWLKLADDIITPSKQIG
jgi:hypothetical protein